MNILLVSEYIPSSATADVKGGVESRCFYVARELAKHHEVSVITSFQGGAREETIADVRVHRAGRQHPYSNSGSILTRLSFAREAARVGRALPKPDIVDAYNFLSYLPGHEIAWHHHAKSVATYHDVWVGGEWMRHKGLSTGLLGELWERRVLSKEWDRFFAVSSFVKGKLEARGIQPESIRVIPNGIDRAGFDSIRTKKTMHPSICCVSRLVPYKQVDTLIRAMRVVADTVEGSRCVIIGAGSERSKLEKLVRELGLEKNVFLIGSIASHDEVLRQMKSSWVCALPSSVEGFGMAALEAMACGTPVVCSDIPAVAEATGGKGGFLVPVGDPHALAAGIIQLLEHDTLRARKGKEAREHAARFDWPIIVKRIEREYQALLA